MGHGERRPERDVPGLAARHAVAEHVNEELDVLLVVLGGGGAVVVAGERHELAAGSTMLVPRGSRRRIEAGDEGLRYLSVHRRRGPLQIQPLPGR